jgi:Fe-S-cluster-containing dehydrogenase component
MSSPIGQADRYLQVHRLQGLHGRHASSGTTCAQKSATTSAPTTHAMPTCRTSMWSIMRFNEIDTPDGGVEWLMRKDSCLHCEDPGCLKACPASRRDRQVRQRHRRLQPGQLHRLRLLRGRLPVQHPAHQQEGQQGLQVHDVFSDRVQVGLAPVCVKTCPSSAISFGSKKDMVTKGEKRVAYLKNARYPDRRAVQPAGRRRHARDVCAAAWRPA